MATEPFGGAVGLDFDGPAYRRLTGLLLPQFMRLSAVQPFERVLVLGLEDPRAALLAAERAGDEGEVLALDPRPEAVEEARGLAAERNLGNVTFRVEETPDEPKLPQAWFDVALCYLSLTSVRDVVATLQALRRATREVGRLGVATWGEPERSRWLTVLQTALGKTAPDAARELPRLPLFSLAARGLLSNRMAEAGYQDVTPERVRTELTFPDEAAYWRFVSEEVEGTAAALRRLTAEQREAVRDAALQGARWYRRRDGIVWFPIEGFVAVAAK